MGDKDYILCLDIIFLQTVLKTSHNTGSHTFGIIMGRFNRRFSDDLLCFIVDGHCFCMCSSYVNPHSNRFTHGLPPILVQ
ncbi:hypothetical protein D3C71_1948580 [compost metagenome]